jgi:hypothetical protein
MASQNAMARGALNRAMDRAANAQLARAHRFTGSRLHEGDHLLAAARARPSHHEHVDDRGVAKQRLLDLLDEHLLAARIDQHRAATEHADRTVGCPRRPIAGHRGASTVDDGERRLRPLPVGPGRRAVCARDARSSRSPDAREDEHVALR